MVANSVILYGKLVRQPNISKTTKKIAFSQIRTDDLLITSEVPYQLGHKGDFHALIYYCFAIYVYYQMFCSTIYLISTAQFMIYLSNELIGHCSMVK